jgi:hypothetical protein
MVCRYINVYALAPLMQNTYKKVFLKHSQEVPDHNLKSQSPTFDLTNPTVQYNYVYPR